MKRFKCCFITGNILTWISRKHNYETLKDNLGLSTTEQSTLIKMYCSVYWLSDRSC